MNCRIADLRNKDVICIADGSCLGYVSDVEVDTCTARLVAIVIYGRPKCFGLMGHEDDCVICWEDIKLIGEDTILVDCCRRRPNRTRHSFVDSLLGRCDN